MLAISQSGATYNYLNWIPSESGPLVTHHGSIQKELENPDRIDEHYYEILDKIFSQVQNRAPICTFSLDSSSVLFSTCNAKDKKLKYKYITKTLVKAAFPDLIKK